MSAELHTPTVLDAVLPSLQTDIYIARERCGSSAEQLLHHKPNGGVAERPRVQQT